MVSCIMETLEVEDSGEDQNSFRESCEEDEMDKNSIQPPPVVELVSWGCEARALKDDEWSSGSVRDTMTS